MKKSQYVFLILFIGYCFISVLNWKGILIIDNKILVGLSASALFMGLSDCFDSLTNWLIGKNNMGYIVRYTIKFIDDKLNAHIVGSNTNVNIRNVKKNLELMNRKYMQAEHPSEFVNNTKITILYRMANIFFILSIFVFVMTPFLDIDNIVTDKLAVTITLIAFSVMCLNLFLSEIANEWVNKQCDFNNKDSIIINSVFNDYSTSLVWHLNYYEDVKVNIDTVIK